MNQSGIYIIQSKESGNFYVGQSVNLKHREQEHWSALHHEVHRNAPLQNAYNKYGREGLEFRILMYIPEDELTKWEQWCLDTWKPEYNIATCAEASRRGTKFTPEQLKRLSDAHKHQRGENHGQNKLMDKDVLEIRQRLSLGEPCTSIAKDFPVTTAQIRNIRHGRAWKHLGPLSVPDIVGERVGTSKLTASDVLEIRDRYVSGETQTQIAKDYPVLSPTISLIVNRKRWGHI